MGQIFQFNKSYFFLAILLLGIEILIAMYVNDAFVRPYIGDLLVAVLVYFFIRSFFKIQVPIAAVAALLFSYLVETLQYVRIVEKLGLQGSKIASTVIGNSFEWLDLVMYTIGIALALLGEFLRAKRRHLRT